MTPARETYSPQTSTTITPDIENVGDSDSTEPEKSVQIKTKDDYPHGMKLVLLAGASIIAVFLISLDQVSTLDTPIDT
jgi:hypothetical protein